MPINVLDLLKYRLSPPGMQAPQLGQLWPDMTQPYGEADKIPVPSDYWRERHLESSPQREERLTNELFIGRMLRDQGSGVMAEGDWQSAMPMPQSMFPSPLNQLMRNPWALY